MNWNSPVSGVCSSRRNSQHSFALRYSRARGKKLPPSDLGRLLKKPPIMSSRAKRGICFWSVFSEIKQMLRYAQHDRHPFSSSLLNYLLAFQPLRGASLGQDGTTLQGLRGRDRCFLPVFL